MGKVGAGFSMSLDGFIAGPGDDVSRVFQWMFMGDTEVNRSSGDTDFELKVSEESAEQMEKTTVGLGAVVSGRGMFNTANAWGGKHPLNVPVVVLTHNPPQEWLDKPDSPFTFVTDNLEHAIREAQKLAGDKSIGLGGANVTQQAIKLGLLDTLGIDLVPVLLGAGVSLFDHLGIQPTELKIDSVVQGKGVTHLNYSFIK